MFRIHTEGCLDIFGCNHTNHPGPLEAQEEEDAPHSLLDHEPFLVTGGGKRGPWEINYPFRGIREPLRSDQNISLVTQNTGHNCVHNSDHKSQRNSRHLNFCWVCDKSLWSKFWVAAAATRTVSNSTPFSPFLAKNCQWKPSQTRSKNSFPKSV